MDSKILSEPEAKRYRAEHNLSDDVIVYKIETTNSYGDYGYSIHTSLTDPNIVTHMRNDAFNQIYSYKLGHTFMNKFNEMANTISELKQKVTNLEQNLPHVTMDTIMEINGIKYRLEKI
jgi:hypothetical protein